MNLIATTAGRPDEQSAIFLREIESRLGIPLVERKKRSIRNLQELYRSDVLVAGKDRYTFYRRGMEEPFFFHPNSAMYRLKRIAKGEADPLMEAAAIEPGDSFLDCTLGLGSDAIVAAHAVGVSGRVEGVEADAVIAFLTEKGLCSFPTDYGVLKEAMERVEVIHSEAVAFLATCPDGSRDIVYMDPMFTVPVEESSNFGQLREIGVQDRLTDEWVQEALRVARKRVVLKDHFRSPLFERFGFQQQIRPYTKVHYGIIEKDGIR